MKIGIIGGGVIGLSLSYELAKRNHTVELFDTAEPGTKASWAGAGIMIPANASTAIHPMEHLEALSHQLHASWSRELKAQTGIDNGYRECGGVYLARTNGEVAALTGLMGEWKARCIPFDKIGVEDFASLHPAYRLSYEHDLATAKKGFAVQVPGESQISNPDHLEALLQAAELYSVTLHTSLADLRLAEKSGHVSIVTAGEIHEFDSICVTAGPWSEQLVSPLGINLPMEPIRGQIALYKVDPVEHASIACGPIMNEGSRYLVPRQSGHVLAGSTIEEVGFDESTTDQGLRSLRDWASTLSTELNDSTYVKGWAGLRPGTFDGFPYIGNVAGFSNLMIAAGHFKGGLHLSTGTAKIVADCLEGVLPEFDIRPLSPNRVLESKPSPESG